MNITTKGALFLAAIGLLSVAPLTASAQTTILSEGFESTFPGSWSVGDANSSGTTAYWSDVDIRSFGSIPAAHTGNWAGYCAGVGHAGTALSPTYQNSMDAYMSRSINLSGYTSATLTFWYIIPSIEAGSFDKCRVYMDSTLLFERTVTVSAWTQASFDISGYTGGTHTLDFEFVSDASGTAEGWYVDDILVTASSAQPDLTRKTDSLSDLNPHAGDAVTASLTVTNQICSGSSVGAGAFHVGFYWSTSPTFSGVSPFFEASVSGCSANSTVSLNQGITISAGTSPGTYYLGYKIDDEGEVTECNENNNGIFYWTVNVVPPPQPDLSKSKDNLSNLDPKAGEMVTTSLTITNGSCSGGSAAAGAFHVGFYWSTTSNFSGVTPFFEAVISGCAANSSVPLNQNITIDPTTIPGTYYLGYKIDDEAEIAECAENNNGIFFWTVTVSGSVAGGNWATLPNAAPGPVQLMLLLSDGTVMAANQGGNAWYRLTPDSHGSYLNGTWSARPSMNSTRLFYSSTVLRDGRVLVAGGEYGTGAATAEIYDPVANSWASIPVPTSLLNPANNSPNTGRRQGFRFCLTATFLYRQTAPPQLTAL